MQGGAKPAIWARSALTHTGWQREVRVEIGADGSIRSIVPGTEPGHAVETDILLPAPANLHCHAFQRGLAGLTERRQTVGNDSFWTWRSVMYRIVERLTPEDIEALAALVYVEMLEAGYASVGEFHYLHHGPKGTPYDNPAELSQRIFVAAADTGIGLTHLPVLYCRGGLAGEPLTGGQRRFGCTPDHFARLWHAAKDALRDSPADTRLGVAPHSLRAVDRAELGFAVGLAPSAPIHLHIAEQTGEVDAVQAAYGRRPVEWLLNTFAVDARWCLVHATHMSDIERRALARAGAVAGLCPITEANLGDGIFDARAFAAAGGRFGIGSDSNVRISLVEELRTLEYSQRLRDRARAVLAEGQRSVGRTLLENAACGGAQALGRGSGRIEPDALADLVSLRASDLALLGLEGDALLDAWIFSGDDHLVDHVWSAGRHVVSGGRHRAGDRIRTRAARVLARLRSQS